MQEWHQIRGLMTVDGRRREEGEEELASLHWRLEVAPGGAVVPILSMLCPCFRVWDRASTSICSKTWCW